MALFGAQPARTDLESTWSFVEEGITQVMSLSENLSYFRYMEIYTTIYNHCTAPSATGGGSMSGMVNCGAQLVGAGLYTKLTDYYKQHLVVIRREAESRSDVALLKYYTEQWQRYTAASEYINHLFRYLNRHWVRREIDEGHRAVYGVNILSLVLWRDHLFVHIHRAVIDAVLSLVKRERDGETIETKLVNVVKESFVALGLDESDVHKIDLKLYTDHFERPFIEAAKEYYEAESKRFINENSVTDYMKKAEVRLFEEEERVKKYLHQDTRVPLMKKCETVLVQNHIAQIRDEFQTLLDNDREEDLARTFSLLSRIENGLEPLREKFGTHVRKNGLAKLEQVAAEKDFNPKAYVIALLSVHQKYSALVQNAFPNDPGFVAAMDQACSVFVNRNKVCSTDTNKSAELLVKYCNALLTNSKAKLGEDELEKLLTNVITIFKYLESKDVFRKRYAERLGSRLVEETSISRDAEESMVAKIREVCGLTDTKDMQQMFSDISISQDLTEEFKGYISESRDDDEKQVDYSMYILKSSSWQFQQFSMRFAIPSEFESVMNRFSTFYESKHQGRKLVWMFHLSRAEMRTTYLQRKFQMQVVAYQMSVLLQYNKKERYSVRELQEITLIEPDYISQILDIFHKKEVLKLAGGKDANDPDAEFELNKDLRPKTARMNLARFFKIDNKKNVDPTMKIVDFDRESLIQLAIVRIMKMRIKLPFKDLRAAVIQQLTGQFKPDGPMLKKMVEVVLDKEILKRDPDDKEVLIYCS